MLAREGEFIMVYHLLNQLLDWVNQFSFENYLQLFYNVIAIFWEKCSRIFDLRLIIKYIDPISTNSQGCFVIYMLKCALNI
jgi:hypothetical protein